MRQVRGMKVVVVLATAIILLIVSASVVVATHRFSDVPTNAFYHEEVDWIDDRNITSGCGGTKYCPEAAVTRGQMAVFMEALGDVLSPRSIEKSQFSVAAIDLDAATNPEVCITSSYTPVYPQTAFITASLSFVTTGSAPTAALMAFARARELGGITFSVGQGMKVQGPAAGIDVSTTVSGTVPLTPGQAYTFHIMLQDEENTTNDATTDITSVTCSVTLLLFNRQT